VLCTQKSGKDHTPRRPRLIRLQISSVCLLVAIALPTFGEKVCDVKTYGAKGDGVSLDTAAIQHAIDDCSTSGGGVVRLTKNSKFASAPIVLRSNITLEIPQGSTLMANSDHGDFPEIEEFHEKGRQALLSSDHAENIVIRGGGTIDGNGKSWWSNLEPGYTRPRLIVFSYSKHILMEGVTVQNSPMWQIVPYYSDDLTFRNMKILAPEGISHNTDGIDPFSSSHVAIDHTLIDTGDDNVAIKSGQPGSAGPDSSSHDITITDCVFLHGHGLSIGSEVAGGVQNVRVERVHFKGTGTGVRIKSNRDRGNDIGNFTYKDLVMEDVATPILISEFYPKIPDSIESAPVTRLTPHFHDIAIENLTATGAREAAIIVGLPESPILRLRLRNVSISSKKGARISYAEVEADHFSVKADQGKGIEVGPGVKGTLK
jgi:polygalacturonase